MCRRGSPLSRTGYTEVTNRPKRKNLDERIDEALKGEAYLDSDTAKKFYAAKGETVWPSSRNFGSSCVVSSEPQARIYTIIKRRRRPIVDIYYNDLLKVGFTPQEAARYAYIGILTSTTANFMKGFLSKDRNKIIMQELEQFRKSVEGLEDNSHRVSIKYQPR